jgi:hypothetical protein
MRLARWLAPLLCIAAALVGYARDATSTPTPVELTPTPALFATPDPIDLTATYIIQRATSAEVALNTAIPPVSTLDPVFQTVTAIYAATETTNVPTSELDPIAMTATHIVQQATLAAATANPPRPQGVGTLDPVFLTVTALYTQGEPPMIRVEPTAAPTLTSAEIELLYHRWKTDLETAAGFSHPAFDEAVTQLLDSRHFSIDGRINSRNFEPEIQIDRIFFDGRTYVAVLVPTGPVSGCEMSKLLLFRMDTDRPMLLPDLISPESVSGDCHIHFFTDENNPYVSGFEDRNGNGYPEIAIITAPGANNPERRIILLEIRPGGEIVDISPITYGNMMPYEFIDLNHDGILEIRAVDWFFDGNTRNPTTRFYGWDGTRYRDISNTVDISLWPEITAFQNALEGSEGCLVPYGRVYTVMLEYIAMERLEEGWVWLQSHTHWDKCTPQQLEQDGDRIDAFIRWLHLQRQLHETRSA